MHPGNVPQETFDGRAYLDWPAPRDDLEAEAVHPDDIPEAEIDYEAHGRGAE